MSLFSGLLLAVVLGGSQGSWASGDQGLPGEGGEVPMTLAPLVGRLLAANAGKSGVYILEKGEESLLARGWLANHAARTIDVQYFIWSVDNIGILAAESLLQAAERGVRVRVIVDDLLIDAPDDIMLALASHPNISIRVYNPQHSVGISTWRRLYNVVTGFRAVNQRMHDKTFIVDGLVAITGGRNMADEYFDYDHRYNFRDRDALLLGPVVAEMTASFERFWQSPLTVPVVELLARDVSLPDKKEVREVYQELHAYAADPTNFAPEVNRQLTDLPHLFQKLISSLAWDEVEFLADEPGKNSSRGLGGGGATTSSLQEVISGARHSIVIQSPYLVLPKGLLVLLQERIAEGVQVKISTNSLASTDNLQAFSGYARQRREILGAGIEVFEYRPQPAIQQELVERYALLAREVPTFAIHAKTLVVDSTTLYVGTFNLDPRSANLNTEVGVLIRRPLLASQVERTIERDMAPENSWSAADLPDRHAPLGKRLKMYFWRLLPLEPLL